MVHPRAVVVYIIVDDDLISCNRGIVTDKRSPHAMNQLCSDIVSKCSGWGGDVKSAFANLTCKMIDTFVVFASRDESEKARCKVATFAPDSAHVSISGCAAPNTTLEKFETESMMLSEAETCRKRPEAARR